MAIVSGFVGFFAPRLYVSRITSTRLVRFEQQLPDTLGLWVNALRSGYSVLQSMEAIARDAPEPTATEFKRLVQEVQLGIDMQDAFEHMLSRLEAKTLTWWSRRSTFSVKSVATWLKSSTCQPHRARAHQD